MPRNSEAGTCSSYPGHSSLSACIHNCACRSANARCGPYLMQPERYTVYDVHTDTSWLHLVMLSKGRNGLLINIHGRCILIASNSDKSWQKGKECVFCHSVNINDGCLDHYTNIYCIFQSLLSIFHFSAASVSFNLLKCHHTTGVLIIVFARCSLHIQRIKDLAVNKTHVMLCNSFYVLSNFHVAKESCCSCG